MPRIRIAFLLLLAACSSTQEKEGEEAKGPGKAAPLKSELPTGELFRTSREAAFMDMLDELSKADAVYVGETHTNADHHMIQLRIIEHLYARGRLHAIGMEMFQRRFQSVLDDYVEGRITEQEMLERTDYKKRWGYDFTFYRPILEFARDKRLPVLALNVENEIRLAARKDGLEGLTQEQRDSLPAIDTSDPDHRKYLEGVYKRHLPPNTAVDPAKFERFYLIMCMWDDVMADTVVRWFRTAPDDGQIVVLAGAGHVANRYGIPGRAKKRAGKRHRVVVPIAADQPERDVFAEAYADFVWVTRPMKAAE